MYTEEFVLIPKAQFTQEQPAISQILNNQNVSNKGMQLSLLQRNQTKQVPTTTFQQDGNVSENATMTTPTQIPTKLEAATSPVEKPEKLEAKETNFKQLLFDEMSQRLKGVKLERSKKIFKQITENSRLALDAQNWRLYIGKRKQMGPRIDEFLYNIQQNTKKLLFREYIILRELQLDNSLVSNTFATQFLLLDREDQNDVLQGLKTEQADKFDEEDSFEDASENAQIATPENWKTYAPRT